MSFFAGLNPYCSFLKTPAGRHWKRIGLVRRSGVAAPLFSLYSSQSIGIGEIPDLKLLVDWCSKTGMSIIQLLPMNDVGTRFFPYDADSTFALEPIYLSLDALAEIDLRRWREEIDGLRKDFPPGGKRVRYGVKPRKLDLLWRMFSSLEREPEAFQRYTAAQKFWLENYALFKVAKEENGEKAWQDWEPSLRDRHSGSLARFARARSMRARFYEWLQWQLYEQFTTVKKHARKHNVLIMGDLPFLVSRDSADVWAHREYFKRDLSAGAPPDAYYANGQRWGMPPYDWRAIEAHRYDYLIERLKYAEHFYDLYRVDHSVGLFRIWTIPLSAPPETEGRGGAFDPSDEAEWEEHGRRILSVMLKFSKMLPCAEDLGTVPPCSDKVLLEYSVPGMDVQRWVGRRKNEDEFAGPAQYRKNAVAVISTHDTPTLRGWWEREATEGEKAKFWQFLGLKGPVEQKSTLKFVRAALEKTGSSASIFSVQQLIDWASLSGDWREDPWHFRINCPGTMGEHNWSVAMPFSLEEMQRLSINAQIRNINRKTRRL